MLSVEYWAEIRRLRRSERLAISEIARVLGISRNTVKAALASDAPPKYQRAPVGSVADEAEPRIRELLAAYPRMPATIIAERIGWSYSIRTLSVQARMRHVSARHDARYLRASVRAFRMRSATVSGLVVTVTSPPY